MYSTYCIYAGVGSGGAVWSAVLKGAFSFSFGAAAGSEVKLKDLQNH